MAPLQSFKDNNASKTSFFFLTDLVGIINQRERIQFSNDLPLHASFKCTIEVDDPSHGLTLTEGSYSLRAQAFSVPVTK